jgi:hypothetical protein
MLDPTIFFFIVGAFISLLKVDIKIPKSIYEMISIFLLNTIGIKGGMELAAHSFSDLAPKILLVFLLGLFLPILAYPILKKVGKFENSDAASIAAHYGSVSVGTYAVSISFLQQMNVPFESYMTLFLVILEFPAIIVGICLAKGFKLSALKQDHVMKEIFLGKSTFLLGIGVLMGLLFHSSHEAFLQKYFISNFKGALALFLLEMGIVATKEIRLFISKSKFLLFFGIAVPMLFALIGANIGLLMGLSVGGVTIMATLSASASYIAVPAAMRTSIPEANPALSLGSSLGITFPFNILIGIPLYYKVIQMILM